MLDKLQHAACSTICFFRLIVSCIVPLLLSSPWILITLHRPRRSGSSPGTTLHAGPAAALRASSGGGGSSLAAAGRASLHHSSDGGTKGSSPTLSSPVSRALSGIALSMQRGLSGAGDAVARTLSGAGLLSPVSYERLMDEAGAGNLPVSFAAGTADGRSARSRLGPDQQQQGHAAAQHSRLPVPGNSAVQGASAAGSLSSPPAAGPAPAPATPWAVFGGPSPAARQQGVDVAGLTLPTPAPAFLSGPHEITLTRPPGLARIRTRPREAATSSQAGDSSLLVQDGQLTSGAPLSGTTGLGTSSSRHWRTREQYQADLAAASSPIALPRHEQQDRRSEPGRATGRIVRGQAGLDAFVQTPTTNDATNR